jgi:hypothetical protein
MPPRLEDSQGSGLVVEVLYVEHCPNFPAALALVQRVAAELGLDVQVRTTLIGDQAAAERAGFPGSPTVRVDGRDVDPDGELADEYTLECRLYWHQHHLAGYPQEHSVREALLRAAGPT